MESVALEQGQWNTYRNNYTEQQEQVDMSKNKFSFDIVTDDEGKVRLENVQHKKVAPKIADALNKVIGEVVRGYNFRQKVCRVNRAFTNRDETRRLIALGLNPKTRDITLVYGSRVRGAFYFF